MRKNLLRLDTSISPIFVARSVAVGVRLRRSERLRRPRVGFAVRSRRLAALPRPLRSCRGRAGVQSDAAPHVVGATGQADFRRQANGSYDQRHGSLFVNEHVLDGGADLRSHRVGAADALRHRLELPPVSWTGS